MDDEFVFVGNEPNRSAQPQRPSPSPGGTSAAGVRYELSEQGRKFFRYFLVCQAEGDRLGSLPFPKPVLSPEEQKAALSMMDVCQRFTETDGRQQVKDLVMKVTYVSMPDLTTILKKLMGRITNLVDGIVVIFFFCYDLAMRELSRSKEAFEGYIDIAEKCVDTILGPKVQENGGWLVVLHEESALDAFTKLADAASHAWSTFKGFFSSHPGNNEGKHKSSRPSHSEHPGASPKVGHSVDSGAYQTADQSVRPGIYTGQGQRQYPGGFPGPGHSDHPGIYTEQGQRQYPGGYPEPGHSDHPGIYTGQAQRQYPGGYPEPGHSDHPGIYTEQGQRQYPGVHPNLDHNEDPSTGAEPSSNKYARPSPPDLD